MFFDAWTSIGRILLTGLLVYVALVLVLRVTGKRTLSKWNAFDFIVTIALGSTLATALLSKEVTVVQGVVALSLLVFLQYGATWLSVRSATVRRLVKSEPTLLLYRGQFQREAMRRERVTESEVRAAVRAAGHGALDAIDAVVLETDGNFSVVKDLGPSGSTLAGVRGFQESNASRTANGDPPSAGIERL